LLAEQKPLLVGLSVSFPTVRGGEMRRTYKLILPLSLLKLTFRTATMWTLVLATLHSARLF
jgi:hypothetical protein